MLQDFRHWWLAAIAVAFLFGPPRTVAGDETARRWIDSEFQPSTLSKDDQLAELRWLAAAAAPFKGMQINVVSETVPTHEYESKVLAKAFTQITGIIVSHELVKQGEVVEKIQAQLQSGRTLYDGWITDSDLIGTFDRYGLATDLTEFMAGAGKDVTYPALDFDDFIAKSLVTGADGRVYQLPDQQFANLYWFRYDWFQNAEYQAKFRAKYGYDLGVPVNWSAYEDIAAFFTHDVHTIGGVEVYGHMADARADRLLGSRFSDAWLPMAGSGDKGLPNGLPVDGWGIRMEGCNPVGSAVERGGDANGPAATYALTKYVEWLKYSPPQAQGVTSARAQGALAQGSIAQQFVWDTSLAADMAKPGLAVVDADGTPKWRMAPSPHGAYWKEGMKRGHQGVDVWTLPRSAPLERRKAAWLYAQFVTSKTVSLKKSHVGLTFVRESDIWDGSFTERASKLGGLIEFYRSPARLEWTSTGHVVPDYPKLAPLWGQAITRASSGAETPQEAIDALATAQDIVLEHLERAGVQGECAPRMNAKTTAEAWFGRAESAGTLAPQRRLANEKPRGETIDYDTLVRSWANSSPSKG
jgi:glycerol transport system substrate-binding protein